VRRILASLAVLAVAVPPALAGSAAPPRMRGPFGQGADIYWTWRASGKPKTVVVFMHGLDQSELYPSNHLPWIDHLAQRGNDVVYPRYENNPGAFGALRHTLVAVRAALVHLGRPRVPVVVVGYSRGGRLAVELAAVTPAIGVAPAAVMSIFPSELNPNAEEVVDLRSLGRSTRLTLVVGQEDSRSGARELLSRLAVADFPPENIEAVVIRSKGSFHADHFSAMQTGPEARRQFWARLDRLIASVR
jgi:pimeloyl-ACP methyl ester carboxylesterase